MPTQSKWKTIVGWILTILPSLLLVFSGTMKLIQPEGFAENVEKTGFNTDVMFYIGIVELLCVLIYLVPQTAVLGAILLAGYMGGAIVTHVRAQEDFTIQFLIGVIIWLGVYFREPRLRAIAPFRSKVNS